jgi:iron complex outermembrane recepter protein
MLSKFVAGSAGQRGMSCAACSFLAAAVIAPSVFVAVTTVTFSEARAQQATSTPLPPIPVQTKKKKKKVTPQPAAQPTGVRQGVDVQEEEAEAEAPAEKPKGISTPLSGAAVQGEAVASGRVATSDTASLLRDVPGVNVYSAGGVSNLPDIHGLNDDRINSTLNGMPIVAACGNHMNPVLSYVDPSAVKHIDVMAGISPVSAGGDSLGSVISVETVAPQFAAARDEIIAHGSFSTFYRSNGHNFGGSASAVAATSDVALSYTGSYSKADDFVDGHGNKVGTSLYEAENHALSLAMRGNSDLLVVDAGIQKIPYQGFPNQMMDMTDNEGWFVNGRYEKKFDWGKLQVQAYYQHTAHEMEFLPDKKDGRLALMRMPDMPMLTDGENMGYKAKAEIPAFSSSMLRVGSEMHRNTLDDWWPPVASRTNHTNNGWVPGGMCCETFWNINNGERTQFGTFVELESKLSKQWTTLLGVRNDIIMMDTGDVQGYNNTPGVKNGMGVLMAYYEDSTAFNARNHEKTDINFDVTAQARYEPNANSIYEFGYARKTRSPSLYERYTWSTNGMAMSMNGWFGDGGLYVGDIDLKPEVANTASFTAAWHDRARKDWEFKVTPYYTYVQDYIGVKPFAYNGTDYTNPWPAVHNAFYKLRFTNQDAELFGADVSGYKVLLQDVDYGRLAFTGSLNYTRGVDMNTGNSLYHMMPLNTRLGLEHKWGHWTNAIELNLITDKELVDTVRLEPKTAGYALVNLRSRYEMGNFRFDFGIDNLFDQYYEPPLGGSYVGVYPIPTKANGSYGAVPGMGRNVYAGMTVKF